MTQIGFNQDQQLIHLNLFLGIPICVDNQSNWTKTYLLMATTSGANYTHWSPLISCQLTLADKSP